MDTSIQVAPRPVGYICPPWFDDSTYERNSLGIMLKVSLFGMQLQQHLLLQVGFNGRNVMFELLQIGGHDGKVINEPEVIAIISQIVCLLAQQLSYASIIELRGMS